MARGITKAELVGRRGWYRPRRRTLVGAIALLSLTALGSATLLRFAGQGLMPRVSTLLPPLHPRAVPELRQGVRRGVSAFVEEVAQGGFVALTGVEQRSPIGLLEGATFSRSSAGVTFVLSDGTVVPPLSPQGYQALRQSVPAAQRWVLDEKFYWFLMRNPALPLIAEGLERGEYRNLLQNGVFNSDRYYAGPFLGHTFWAAAQAQVPLAELMPLVEVHLLTLEYAYFQGLDTESAGTVYSFYEQELALTNLQYLMRALVMTPLEPWAKLEAIERVEAPEVKAAHTGSTDTSTTLALGRLPLPTPTAAEDTPGAHALSIAHLSEQGIHLFPPDVEAAAGAYKARYQDQLAAEDQLVEQLRQLAHGSTAAVLEALEHYQGDRPWQALGFTPALDRRSVASMDTTSLLGIYATRHESLAPLTAAQSYPLARRDYLRFFQTNSPGLKEADLLLVLLSDQALNPRLWAYLRRQQPALEEKIVAIQTQRQRLEASYRATALQEALLFQRLQVHGLDINTQAFSLLSVAMAKRLGDLVYAQFQPENRTDLAYLRFSRGLLPYLRDMPSLDAQWGHGPTVKRYGLSNYVVPDLMALTPARSPTLAAIGALWFDLVSHGQVNRWDFAALAQTMATAHNLSIGHPPSALPPQQGRFLPLVAAYQPQLSQVTGVDGANASSVLHGQTLQDFRIPAWPAARLAGATQQSAFDPAVVQQLFPAEERAESGDAPLGATDHRTAAIVHLLSSGSGEIALAPSLVLLGNPEFLPRPDGALDLAFDFDGDRLIFPEVSRHFEALYAPAYLTRIALPREPGESYTAALNQVIGRSHALYGGYLPPNMLLPAPLQRLPN
ncbi:hypothetical protein PGN35_021095 [Nodosilinea sp. PGN35]|uniref:hypothetical protein n=1 Tax=Nodosilinea sp. PGN35 TaxID=3020489 RepID=UPI0023B2F765|nr:hypothetical protein [Nodosilinea sp. TSF1-S3]MDF0366856.1 hypothetical protein [Nodosilinea sp. TSF1-S3]